MTARTLLVEFGILSVLLAFSGRQAEARKKPADVRMASAGIQYLNSSYDIYDGISRRIHSYAETGFREYRSADELCRHLEENGFSVERGVAGIPTSFIARYGSGSPVIGLMAEYDALPGLAQEAVPYPCAPEGCVNGHGCGHNLLGTGSLAGAVAISRYLALGHK